MKVSEEKKQTAYNAISEPIIDLRIRIDMAGRDISTIDLDGELFKLERQIWKHLKLALNIED